jgi:hypothetical protein
MIYSDNRVETAEIGQPGSRLWFVIIVDQRSGVRLLCPAMNAARKHGDVLDLRRCCGVSENLQATRSPHNIRSHFNHGDIAQLC